MDLLKMGRFPTPTPLLPAVDLESRGVFGYHYSLKGEITRSTMNTRVSSYFSEFIGTFLMVLIGVRLLFTSMLFACATSVVYAPGGRISGVHLNPAKEGGAVSYTAFMI